MITTNWILITETSRASNWIELDIVQELCREVSWVRIPLLAKEYMLSREQCFYHKKYTH